jgi:hypothetical protein
MSVVSARRDETTLYGIKKIKVNNKNVSTPKKTVGLENLREDIEIHTDVLGEIYKTFSKDRITALIGDEERQVKFNYELNTHVKKAQHFPIGLLLFVPGLAYSNPSENELSFIIATQEHYSDFYVVPTIEHLSKLMKNATFSIQDYLTLIDRYLNLIEGYRGKAIMGMVPINIPFQYIEALMDTYLKRGVEFYCIDVGGRVALSLAQQVIAVQRALSKNNIDAFIHATNINIGRAKKGSRTITARDVLSFGLGFDSIGDNHVRPYVRDAPKNPEINLRLFDKDAYAYHKIQEEREIEAIYPDDSTVKPEYLLDNSAYRRRKAQAMFNYEQLSMETERLRRVIDEGVVTDYVRNKRYVDRDSFRVITTVKEGITKVRSLEEFLR